MLTIFSQDMSVHPGQPTGFNTISNDVLFCITDFLEDPDKVCLSLCSRSLRASIGTSTWARLRLDAVRNFPEIRKHFLILLARDMGPGQVFCTVCIKIHPATRLAPLATIMHQDTSCNARFPILSKGSGSGDWNWTFRHHNYNFSRMHIDQVMKRHRNGSDHGIAIELLSVKEIRAERPFRTIMLSVEPNIMANNLYLRVQQLWLFPAKEADQELRMFRFTACPHYRYPDDTFRCEVSHATPRRDCPVCYQSHKCGVCGVQFNTEVRNLKRNYKVVIVTKILRLGDGETPKRNLAAFGESYILSDRKWWDETKQGFSEAWAAFDGQGHQPLHELTNSNLSIMCRKSYKTDFTRLRCPWLGWPYAGRSDWVYQPGTDISAYWFQSA